MRPLDPRIEAKLYELLEKPVTQGPDVDVRSVVEAGRSAPRVELASMEAMKGAGSYVRVGVSVVRQMLLESMRRQGVVFADLERALGEFPLAKEYVWRAVRPDQDKFTAAVALARGSGLFMYVPPGTKVKMPFYACFLLARESVLQPVHNVIVIDEGSEVTLISSCASAAKEGVHLAVSEIYVKRGAKLSYAMVHSWQEGVHVRPRTAVIVEEDAAFSSYYVLMSPPSSIHSLPRVTLGRRASCYSSSVIFADRGCYTDLGYVIELREDSSAEVVSRVVAKGGSRNIQRLKLVAKGRRARGHIDCSGVLLDERSSVEAVPSLVANVDDVELTHEAAIGRLDQEALSYLMSKGFTESEARSILIHGFVFEGMKGLPKDVKLFLSRVLSHASKRL